MKPIDLIVIVQPGLERYARLELMSLGISDIRQIKGALLCKGHLTTLIRINLFCRTVSRVLCNLGTFRAGNFRHLTDGLASLPWDDYLPPNLIDRGFSFCLRVHSYQSDLYHEKAVAQRIIHFLSDRLGGVIPVQSSIQDENTILLVIHIKQDLVQVRLDSSGIHLHKRGYSKFTETAPLRETIATAMIMASGWQVSGLDLLDPMCGSGTIPIEAALMAKGHTWERHRRFTFMDWACFDPGLIGEALASLPESCGVQRNIRAADSDAKAIATAQDNCQKGGVEGSVSLSHQSLDQWLDEDLRQTMIITNPPWGIRLVGGEWQTAMTKLTNRVASIYLLIPDHEIPRVKPRKTIFQTRCGEINTTFCLL